MIADRTWRAASNGSGKMRWFVCRERPQEEWGRRSRYEYGETVHGQLRRFGSHEAAQRCADGLNAAVTA